MDIFQLKICLFLSDGIFCTEHFSATRLGTIIFLLYYNITYILHYFFQERNVNYIQQILARTRADQHKCLPNLACITLTLLFVEYFSVFSK